MLITSNTIQPNKHSSGRPLVNARLYVRSSEKENSEMLPLYRDAACTESAPNPITLNSAGELPYPIYTAASRAWCFLSPLAEKKQILRKYPLCPLPYSALASLPEEGQQLNSLAARVGINLLHDRYSGQSASIEAGDISCDSLDIGAMPAGRASLKKAEIGRMFMNYQEFGAESKVVMSPVAAKTEAGEESFKIGSYRIAYFFSTEHLGKVLEVDEEMREKGVAEWFDSKEPFIPKYTVRACGTIGLRKFLEYRSFYATLVCRVRDKDD